MCICIWEAVDEVNRTIATVPKQFHPFCVEHLLLSRQWLECELCEPGCLTRLWLHWGLLEIRVLQCCVQVALNRGSSVRVDV